MALATCVLLPPVSVHILVRSYTELSPYLARSSVVDELHFIAFQEEFLFVGGISLFVAGISFCRRNFFLKEESLLSQMLPIFLYILRGAVD